MAITTYKIKTNEVRYRATIWIRNRPLQSKSFARKIDARDWERRVQTKIEDGRVGRLKGEKTTLNEFFHQVYWPSKRIREGTAKDYMRIFKNHVDPKFGQRRLSELTEEEWSLFLTGLVNKGMSHARANRVRTAISAFYSNAVRFKYVSFNPLQSVEWFEEDLHDFDYWTIDEAFKFLNWAHQTNNPSIALYQTAYETGMRVSELQALKRDCVDLAGGTITVRRAYCRITKQILETTKGKKKRTVGINPGLVTVLQRHLGSHTSPLVFGTPNEVTRYELISARSARDQKAAEVRPISFHAIRHTYASHFVMQGGNVYDLQQLLGHAQVETTMRYAHLSPGHLKSKSQLVSFKPEIGGNVVALNSPVPKHFPNIGGENEANSGLLVEVRDCTNE